MDEIREALAPVLRAAGALDVTDLDEAIRSLRRLHTAVEAAEDELIGERNRRANAEARESVRLDLADVPLH